MALTSGLNHLGLTVRDLDATTTFFADVLGWDVTAHDDSYPRTKVTDGSLRLTLWQVQVDDPAPFDRKTALGLHHLALEMADEATLKTLSRTLADHPDVAVEFMPEPGGLRIELLWSGA